MNFEFLNIEIFSIIDIVQFENIEFGFRATLRLLSLICYVFSLVWKIDLKNAYFRVIPIRV